MLQNSLSLKLLQEATTVFLSKLSEAKKEQQAVIKEYDKHKVEKNITKIKSKLGI